MAFQNVNNYIGNNLAADTAGLLNLWVANFPNVQGFYGPNGYFNEATVQAAMYTSIVNWVANQAVNNQAANISSATTLVLSEARYSGYANVADLAVVYNDGAHPVQTIYIELKTDFNVNSVDNDINLLDLIAGAMNSPVAEGYVFYTVINGNAGWAGQIGGPTQANVTAVAINVNA